MATNYTNTKYETIYDIIESSKIENPYIINIDHNLVNVTGEQNNKKISVICYKYLDTYILLDYIEN